MGMVVGLPVRTTLLQNISRTRRVEFGLDYQSERHCSKTFVLVEHTNLLLDYQSERHCSKTSPLARSASSRWITSQNDTAPKRWRRPSRFRACWITSQNDTAPKRDDWTPVEMLSWITSQNDTAPKPLWLWRVAVTGWITSQNDTAPKPAVGASPQTPSLDYQSERHCSKTLR